MKIRIRIDAIFDPIDTTHIDDLRNKVVALRDFMGRITPFETSSITVENCRHDEGGQCEILYQWEKE